MKMREKGLWGAGLVCMAKSVYATTVVTSVTKLAGNIETTIGGAVSIITAGSYVAGIAFTLGSIMKFKQHKDNPTQIPIGTPIAMLFIGAALLFFPTVLTVAGVSVFGSTTNAGTQGTIWGVSS